MNYSEICVDHNNFQCVSIPAWQ